RDWSSDVCSSDLKLIWLNDNFAQGKSPVPTDNLLQMTGYSQCPRPASGKSTDLNPRQHKDSDIGLPAASPNSIEHGWYPDTRPHGYTGTGADNIQALQEHA